MTRMNILEFGVDPDPDPDFLFVGLYVCNLVNNFTQKLVNGIA